MKQRLSILFSALIGGTRGGLLLLALVATTSLWAYDFQSGDLYYNITSDTTVEVTYQIYWSCDNYKNLKDVVIPEKVTHDNITYLVTSIGEYTFSLPCDPSSSQISSITIPNSVTSIGEQAFSGCSSLTSITIPKSVTSIYYAPFNHCPQLISIIVEEGNTTYDSRNNCNAIIETATNTLIAGCQKTIIPNSVTSIGERAFDGCSSLTSITIPNSVTSIGNSAFYVCSSLTSITIPNGVTSIGNSAFNRCSSLISMVVEEGNTTYDSRNNCNAIIETATNTLITGCQNTLIPNSVTSIGHEAFNDCSSLTSITIPNSVTSIGVYAFSGCGLTSITIPNSVTSIGDNAFYDCSSLTSITIPNSVTSIGDNAFYDCSSLTSITIPNSVTSIGEWAFDGCTGLTSITIPNSVTSIGDYAFWDCSSLNSVICEAITPPTLDYNSFTSSPICYIPFGTLAAYQASAWASQVSKFVEQEAAAPTTITYELNGGVTNDDNWLSKGDMWTAFCADAGITTLGTLDEVKATADPYGTICGKLLDANVTTILGLEKWDWLEAYIMAFQNAAGGNALALTEGKASIGWRYAFASFFLETQRTSWPYTADFAAAGKIEAFQATWKHGFANPTNPTSEWTLNTPYKEGYTFDGWFAAQDFSGEKVLTVNAEYTGTLYAKWIDYIPTTEEVKAMEDGTETKVSGVVNHILGNILYIQDIKGGIRIVATEAPTCKVGQKIVAKGVKAVTNGAYEVKNATVESAEDSKLYDVIEFETLAELLADSINHEYFAKRIRIPSLTIVEYDAYNNPIVQDLSGNKLICQNKVLDPTDYPIGTRITLTTVAGWDNGFQILGAATGIVRTIAAKKENYTYPKRHDKYTLSNNWVTSNVEGNFAYNKPGATDHVRGMAAKDGIMYFIHSINDNASNFEIPLLGEIVRVDGKTGNMLEPIKLTGEHLFETQDVTIGAWKKGVTMAFNDIKFDQAGNCLIGACVMGSTHYCQAFYIYLVDLNTGKCTKLIEDYLWDNTDLNNLKFRFDAFGVAGDVTKDGVIMAADANGTWNVFRWLIQDGVAGEGEQVAVSLDPTVDQSLFINAAGYSTAPQIFPRDEVGSTFYVDGFNTLPMLFNESGRLQDDFINVPTGTKVWNDNDTISMNPNFNGLVEFQVGEEYFLLMVARNNVGAVPSTYALYKFADANRMFEGMEPLWYFPHNGLGSTNIGFRTAVPSVEVVSNTEAVLYLYAANNGYASYTLKIDGLASVETHTLTVLSNDNTMGTVYGSGTYNEGQIVTIGATAENGYYFKGWSDGNTDNPRTVQVTEDQTYTAYFEVKRIIKEDYSYPSRDDNKYTLENNWVSSRAERNFIAPGTEGMVRGMAMKDGVMYFINRELRALVPVDAATGQMGEPIFITGEHLFQAETEVEGVMEWKSAVTLPFNDVKVDHAGNVLVGACLTNSQTFFVYKVNLETGEATEVIKERLYDNTDLFPTGSENYRFDAFGVYGDVDRNACIMAANGKGMDVYRWIIKDGVADKAERILIQLDPEFDVSYNINVTSLGFPPQIYPQDETGSAFYVDGKDVYPMLIDEDGLLVEDMIHIPTGLKVVNNPGDTLTIDGAMNGMIEFQVGDEYFFLMAASNFNKSIPATFALFKFADASRSFAGAEPLWYFPAKGFGDGYAKNGTFTAPVSVEVEGNTATIAVYSQNLGYASYTLTIDETVQTHQLTVLSNDNAMGSVSGSGTYKQGQSVTITATANNGYHFSHWNDGNTDNPRTLVLTQDTTLTAEFAPNQYSITTDSADPERGTTQGDTTVNYLDYVSISATANYGYHFTQWNDGNTDNPRTVQVTEDIVYTAQFDKNIYTITTIWDNQMGSVSVPDSAEYLDEITIIATPIYGYHFVQWSDGNTDNPRTLVLTQDTILTAEFALTINGQCGDNLYWNYDQTNKTLSITGYGKMYDYTKSTQPWYLFQEQITEVTISNTTTSIGTSAFEGCIRLGKVSLGSNMENIAANAFAGCNRLYDIYVYATYPPFADESSFANYNVYLYIPCENQRDYILDIVWGKFKFIECIGAESDETGGEDVTVTPGSTDVTITWPTEDDAETYSIVITKDGEVFCTLTFNKDGQLLNIAFAPSRDGQHRAQYAELTTKGLRFTVTGLESGTNYDYTITTKDSSDQTISTYSGEFTTQSDVTTDNGYGVSDNGYGAWNIRKEFRNGQLIILRDGVEYNTLGAKIQ